LTAGDEVGEVLGDSFGLLPQHEVAGVFVDNKPGAGDGCGEHVTVLQRQQLIAFTSMLTVRQASPVDCPQEGPLTGTLPWTADLPGQISSS
jgi:hypothetical protein